jgi:DeoR/GlpR family transcriptional regulator of sugar metabolism
VYQEERMMMILRHLKKHHRISVQEICGMFGVSRDTARRDLVKLSEQNAIIRTRGGAILPVLEKEVDSYKKRVGQKSEAKAKIGRLAAATIQPRDHILMDTSTTVQYAAQALEAQNVVVVTNSIDIADILSGKEGVKLHVLGGVFDPHSRYIHGAATLRHLQEFRVNKCLMGGGGITKDGIFVKDEEEGQVVKQMIACSEQVIVLADHTKFGKQFFYQICRLEDVDLLVTDRLPDHWKECLEKANVEWHVAEG